MADYEIFNPFVNIKPFARENTLKMCAKQWFAPKLEKAGFASYKNEGLSWYRVINHEVLQTVYLFTDSRLLPADLKIGYASHPFYLKVPIPQKPLLRGYVCDELLMTVRLPCPKRQIDALLLPTTDEHGAEALDQIVLPKLNRIHCFEDSYKMHKQFWLDWISEYQKRNGVNTLPPGVITSVPFAIETVVSWDEEMLPICIAEIEREIRTLEGKKLSSVLEKHLASVKPLLKALKGENRNEYLKHLEKERTRFCKRFTRLTGIEV